MILPSYIESAILQKADIGQPLVFESDDFSGRVVFDRVTLITTAQLSDANDNCNIVNSMVLKDC